MPIPKKCPTPVDGGRAKYELPPEIIQSARTFRGLSRNLTWRLPSRTSERPSCLCRYLHLALRTFRESHQAPLAASVAFDSAKNAAYPRTLSLSLKGDLALAHSMRTPRNMRPSPLPDFRLSCLACKPDR